MDEYSTASYNRIGNQSMNIPHCPNKQRWSEGPNGVKQRVLYVPMNGSVTSGTMPSNSMSVYGSYLNNKVECPKGNLPDYEFNHQMSNAPVNNKMPSGQISKSSMPPPSQQKSSGGMTRAAPVLTSRFLNPDAMTMCTSNPKTNKEPAKEAPKIHYNTRKKLQKEICRLDNLNHHQRVELSCGLCSIIVPDENNMIRHTYSHTHLMNLLKCWKESIEKTKEVMGNEDYGSDSSSSESSDEIISKKQRVQWNLTDEVGMDTDYVAMDTDYVAMDTDYVKMKHN